MLPFRAGDLTLPAILKSINNTSWIEGGRILIKSRILDVSSMGILMICAAILTQVRISFTLRFGWMGVGIAMMISPLIISWLISSGSRNASSAFRNIILKFATVSAIKRQEVVQSLGMELDRRALHSGNSGIQRLGVCSGISRTGACVVLPGVVSLFIRRHPTLYG